MKQPKRKTASAKKVKSFNIDDEVYSKLMKILDESKSPIGLSVLVNEFLRQFYEYLTKATKKLKDEKTDLSIADVVYDSLKMRYFDSMSFNMFVELLDGIKNPKFKMLIEHVQSRGEMPLWPETRITNLINSHEASKRGMTVEQYLNDKYADFEDDKGFTFIPKKVTLIEE
jgi:hypothetical protein